MAGVGSDPAMEPRSETVHFLEAKIRTPPGPLDGGKFPNRKSIFQVVSQVFFCGGGSRKSIKHPKKNLKNPYAFFEDLIFIALGKSSHFGDLAKSAFQNDPVDLNRGPARCPLNEPRKKKKKNNSYFPLYWLFHKILIYIGLL